MKCPRDGTELSKVHVADIELDKCHQCDGIWYDPKEMERLSKARLPGTEDMLEEKYGDPPPKQGEVEGYMRCPRCKDGRLQGHFYTYTKPVRIDRCDQCFGVWLDKGELDSIVAEKEQLDSLLGTFLRFVAGKFKRA
jgi:Zn-finger nucleic acid-binding protein